MEKIKKIRISHILFFAVALTVVVFIIIFSGSEKLDAEKPQYEPAPPEAPRLTGLGVMGEELNFSPEERGYEIKVPDGNPLIPEVWANCDDEEVEIEVVQGNFKPDTTETYARVILTKGRYHNSYEIKFVKSREKGFVLRYDDRYIFSPAYIPEEGEVITFAVGEGGWNVRVDEHGVISVVGLSDTPAVINALVNGSVVDSITVTATIKAPLNIFIVTGQGNAAGEGGNIEESEKPVPGTAYTVELDDRNNEMRDMSGGRNGFTPALAAKYYSLTGEKTLFLQTAVSDVSVSKWTSEGEVFKMAENKIKYFTERLGTDESPYVVKKVICLWLQGEWDIANGMGSVEYMEHFTDFYNSMKTVVRTDMTAIIPVRSSLSAEGEFHVIQPVCSAQYMLSNILDDVRIITRIPETATVENGYISAGNLYYTQAGYNALGSDVALNLHNCYDGTVDKSVKNIQVYGDRHDSLIEYGANLELKKNTFLRTIAVVEPLWADKNKVTVKYDDSVITYGAGGVIHSAESDTADSGGEIIFECGGRKFKFNVEFSGDASEVEVPGISYSWSFEGLNENNNENDLTLSSYSAEDGYSLAGGILNAPQRSADFTFEKPVILDSEHSWEIKWCGVLNDNGILLGGNYSTKGYIYLAPFAQNMGYSVRMVDSEGQTFYLSYGEYTEKNRSMDEWRIAYDREGKTFTLYSGESIVNSVTAEKPFSFTFTNLLGRYGSENVNYCYTGSLDSLEITEK